GSPMPVLGGTSTPRERPGTGSDKRARARSSIDNRFVQGSPSLVGSSAILLFPRCPPGVKCSTSSLTVCSSMTGRVSALSHTVIYKSGQILSTFEKVMTYPKTRRSSVQHGCTLSEIADLTGASAPI